MIRGVNAGFVVLGIALTACTPDPVQVNPTGEPGSTTAMPTETSPTTTATTTGGPATVTQGSGESGVDADTVTLDESTGSSSSGGSSFGGGSSEGSSSGGSSSTSSSMPVCGDGNPDPGEACDDANQDDLDGCLSDCRQGPTGIDYGGLVALPAYGNLAGGTLYDDACPPGEVLIGLRGTSGGWISQTQAVCGALSLIDPGDIALSLVEATILPLRGALVGFMYDATCPAGSAVVGFSGGTGSLVDRVALRCAPIILADDGVSLSLEVGAPSDLMSVGGLGGDAFGPDDCAPGQVVTVANIRAGDSIDALGLTCRPISLAF